MADVVDPATRSRMMSGIRGTNTRPEKIVRSILHAAGFRFRLHRRDLPGRPDIVLPRHNAVVFVHGCFWHQHQCHLFKQPGTRTEFWMAKLSRNRSKDQDSVRRLLDGGWRVATIWECAVRGRSRLSSETLGLRLREWLVSSADMTLTIEGETR